MTDARALRARHYLTISIALLAVVSTSATASIAVSAIGVSSPAAGHPSAWAATDPVSLARASLAAGHGPGALAHGASARTSVAPFPSTAGWVNLTAKVLPAPTGTTDVMTYDGADHYVVMLSGETYTGSYHVVRNTWTFANGVWTNITATVTGAPAYPAGGAMTYVPWLNEVLYFGGENSTFAYSSYTWTYHAGVWTNISSTAGTPPAARIIPVLVADTTDHAVILFGGQGRAGFLNDTWLFANNTWSNITTDVSGPAPLNIAAAGGCDDPAVGGVLVSGIDNHVRPYLPQTWVFGHDRWQNLSTSAPAPAYLPLYPDLAYSAQTGAAVETSSVNVGPSGSNVPFPFSWVFYAGGWINLTHAALVPGDSTLGGLTAMPDGSVLQFGGAEPNGIVPVNWMYAFSLPPNVTRLSATPSTTDVGMPVAFLGTLTGGVSPLSENLSFGDGSHTLGTLSSSHGYTASGGYTATLNVSDFAGRVSATTVSVTVNSALAASAISVNNSHPTTGANDTFSVTASGGTSPYTYAWTFSDGGTATGATVHHAFAKAGNFTATVVVVDSVGAQVTKTASGAAVAPSSSSGFSLTSGSGLYALIGILVVIVIVIGVAIALMRRKKPVAPPQAVTGWNPPTGAAPSGGPAPPTPPPSGPSPPGS